MRHAAIDAAKAEQLAGRRVLEIASHDGRWSFAAVTAGASCVVGVESRSELIDSAQDVVLCLGFFYHTACRAIGIRVTDWGEADGD